MSSSERSPILQTLRWAFATVALLIGFVALWQVREVLLLSLAAVLLTILLTSPVRWLVRRRVPRPLAIAVALLGMTSLMVLLVALALPQIVTQFGQLIELIPQAVIALEQRLAEVQLPPGIQILPEDTNALLEQVLNNLGNITSTLFPQLGTFFGGVTSVIFSVLVVGFMSMYFLLDPGMHERGLVSLLPLRFRPRAWEIIHRLDRTLRGYLQAKVTSMVLVGLGTGAGLYLLGVPLAPALGVITGLFSFVPNFGPLAALVPTLAVTIINAPDRVLWVVVLYYGIQLVESQFVGPLLVSHEINLPPVLVLISQIVFVVFFGFLGLLLSVPLIAIVQVLVQEIYIKDILGDRGPETARPSEPPVVMPEVPAQARDAAPPVRSVAPPQARAVVTPVRDETRRQAQSTEAAGDAAAPREASEPISTAEGTPKPPTPRQG